MPTALPPGPYKTLSIDGLQVPWYIVPFDKEGQCTGPQTQDHMLDSLASGGFTDLFLFSHGWNNDWSVASQRYDSFIESYTDLRERLRLDYGRPYRPLLAGIFWPSTALVLPSEEGPEFAAAAADRDAQVADDQRDMQELGAVVPAHARPRFYDLLQQSGVLTPAEEVELAQILAPIWNTFQQAGADQTDVRVDPMTASELVALWRSDRAALQDDDDEYGGLADGSSVMTGAPGAALSLSDVVNAPRNLVRVFTVLQMKDRAVRVGGSGVSVLLQAAVQRSAARIHLIGHSYGCVVLLSALSAAEAESLPRKVDSVLLLQAAVSRLCFAEKVPGKPYPGGYRVAFDRVVQPILATFTKRDAPLTKLFHWAVRRDSDLGQPMIAGVRAAPSKYSALGGYGPDGCRENEHAIQTIHNPGDLYDLKVPGQRIIALQADEAIRGHGDVSVPQTWWALYNQVRTA